MFCLRVVDEAIEDGIGDGNRVMPVIDGQLACHDRRAAAVPVFRALQEVAALFGKHGCETLIVEDEKGMSGRIMCRKSHAKPANTERSTAGYRSH
jgi:hypothetical protein